MSKYFIKHYKAATDWAGNFSPECFQIETYHPPLPGKFSASPEFSTLKEAEDYLARLEIASVKADLIMNGSH